MNRKNFILPVILALVVAFAAVALAADTQSASGTVKAVNGSSFTLETSAGETIDFVTNAETKVEGKLAEGASAQVTYRDDGEQLVAVSVKVQAS